MYIFKPRSTYIMSVMDTEQGGIGGVSNKENGVGPNKGVGVLH